ncbi:MAG: hypothetical protein AB1498_06950 [bacterium]
MPGKKNLMFLVLSLFLITLLLRLTIMKPKQMHVPLKYKPMDKNVLFKETRHADFDIPELKLNELNKPKIKYPENTKNIFKSIIIPPVKYIPPPPVIPAPPPPPVPKRNPLEDELKKFQFIGFSENKGKTSVFLSKGDNLYVTSKGEKIEDKFLVKNITQTDITLALINQTDIEYKISLKEEQGTAPNYQEPPPIPYQEINEPQVYEEPPPIPEEPPVIPPVQPVPNPMHGRPVPPQEKEGFPPESEF